MGAADKDAFEVQLVADRILVAELVTSAPSGWMPPDREISKHKIGKGTLIIGGPYGAGLEVLPSCQLLSGVCHHFADATTEALIIIFWFL